ncbi:hypothetical protein, partial [Massilia genomosp. 1]|uniref:hypothetical protein n=1 Tax=Massilia genomosp. 1 TaxID=2609280 RepID=UPI001C9E27DA
LFRGGKLGKIWKGAQFCHDQHHGPISRNEQLWHVLAQAKQLRRLQAILARDRRRHMPETARG